MGETTTADHGGRGRRRPGSHGGGWCRRAEPAARPGGLRAALARGRAADPCGPALLLPPGPAASQQGLRLQPAPHPRGAQRLHPAAQRAEEARALPAGRRAPADQAGQGLLPRQVLRVPGPRAGDHPGQAAQRAERRRGLRAQGLAAGERAGRRHEAPGAPHGGAGGAAGQAAGGGLAGPGRPHPAALGRDLLPRPRGALGGQHPEHALQELQDRGGDAPAPAREGPEERELPAALRGGRAAERLRGQAAVRAPAAGRAAAAERGGGVRGLRRHAAPRLEAPRHLRRGGARVLRVAQRPDARAELAGRPGGQLRPGAEGAPHRLFLGLRRALLHVQGREEGAGAGGARALPGRGEADPAAHPRVEALRRRGRAAGAVLVRGPAGGAAPAHGRRREPQGGHQQPGAVLRAEAEAGHQDPRAAGGARGAAEVVRGAQPGVPGPAPGRLGARDFFEAAEGEAGSARRGGEAADLGRAGRQVRAVRMRADGRHLRAGPRGAGEAGLCGQRANFAGAVRRLPQREDAARERAAHEFGEPRGPRRHGVRQEPQAASSGF